jgi:serine/threonine protein kinase
VSPPTTCPDRAALERLIAGTPPDPSADALFAHIEHCPECVRTVMDLNRGDTLPDLIRSGVTADTAADRAAVEALVRRILSHRPTDPTQTVAAPTVAGGADEVADVLAVLSPPQSEGEIGRLGGYRVLKLLGHGGMGAVFQAEDPKLGRLVALKVMLPGVARKPGMKDRFLREARAAAALEHDHVVPVYEVNEANGVPFIAMPFLRGGTLADRLTDADGPRPVSEVLAVGRQIAAGLAAAHARGLVHRDIKPANIWLDATAGGRVKILDFGLARRDADQDLTQSGSVLGTPSYMAPEQARGQAVDGRADLFSLGVVLYRMAAGRLPFRGDSILAVLSALANDTPSPVRELNPKVPAKLADLIHRLLAKKPADRPASAGQVIADLDRISAPVEPATGGQKKRPWLPIAAAAAVLALAGISFGIYKLQFETKDGTLVVEVDDSADVRFKQGKLEVYDADGKLRYTLAPSEKNKALPAGQYKVQVVGADGLTLATDRFELTKGGTTTVRVTAVQAATVAQADPPKVPAATTVATDFRSETAFPGKLVFRDTFETKEKCKLPLTNGPPMKKEVAGGRYVVSNTTNPNDVLTAELGPRVKVGAFAVRARAEHGQLFVNFRDRTVRESNLRWHTLIVGPSGAESVVLNRKSWDKTRWGEVTQSVLQWAPPDPTLAAGQWVTLAARWSETEYEVWVNGKRVAGGAADPAEVTATTSPAQVCVRPAGTGPAKLELEYVSVWDQTGLPVTAVGPKFAADDPARRYAESLTKAAELLDAVTDEKSATAARPKLDELAAQQVELKAAAGPKPPDTVTAAEQKLSLAHDRVFARAKAAYQVLHGSKLFDAIEKPREKLAETNAKLLSTQTKAYAAKDGGTFPKALKQLVVPADGRTPFVDGGVKALADPWGVPYQYELGKRQTNDNFDTPFVWTISPYTGKVLGEAPPAKK